VVGAYLLDVNLLLALAWPAHVHHADAHEWFHRKRATGFATCPLTQLGFVRLSSNPRFTKESATPYAALTLLASITELKEHVFWPDSLPCGQAFAHPPLIVGHQQFADFYLIALAHANRGVLATFDRAMPTGPCVEIL
jgi:toxin-antitoxin system PIN domain toxin